MNKNFLNIYNNLIKLTRNKLLYSSKLINESFSDRLIIFLFHFAFFLKIYKNESNKAELQKLYDFIFNQIELSIREIGYGDSTVNKKMKDYVNLFYSILEKIENWDIFDRSKKTKLFRDLMNIKEDNVSFIEYFDKYIHFLSKNSLKNFTKDIIEFKF